MKEMYTRMKLIRVYEDTVNFLFLQGKLAGTIHQCQGQEATAVGAATLLNDDDYITTTHRPAGHCLAKGMSVDSMMAEMFGRTTGCCKAKGGSMHLGDIERGVIPAIAIVAGGIPITSGLAMAFKMQRTSRVAMAFMGDGAVNEGAFHEGINLAAIWMLPAIFICENNFYGASTHVSKVIATETIAERTKSYGIPVDLVDGNDVIAVFNSVSKAVARARRGEGATFIECQTYRRTGHSRSDPNKYRIKEEEQYWLTRDPITLFRLALVKEGYFTDTEIDAIDAMVQKEVDDSVEKAKLDPEPKPEDALQHVFSDIEED
jgi:pyruvate dehydrogenase E1 component alpha subunit